MLKRAGKIKVKRVREGEIWARGGYIYKINDGLDYSGEEVDEIMEILGKIKEKGYKEVVRVYGYGKEGNGFWYKMEALEELSDDECTKMDNVDIYGRIRKDVRIRVFMEGIRRIREDGLRYVDYWGRNVMKDKGGRYKLIDVEGFTKEYD